MSSLENNIYKKPLPVPTPDSEKFWAMATKHELWIQKCLECDTAYFYPRMICPDCLSNNVEWFKASGKGTLHTYMINHRAAPGFEDEVPYAIAIVQLIEGPRMMTNIVGVENTPENLILDMPLRIVFDDVTENISIPKWEPDI